MIRKPAGFTIFNCAKGVKIQLVHCFMPRVVTNHIVTDPAEMMRIYNLVGELCDLDYLKPENFYERWKRNVSNFLDRFNLFSQPGRETGTD